MRTLHRTLSTAVMTAGLAATIAASLAAGGCKKDGAGGGSASASASSDLALLPVGADFVAGLNLKQLQTSGMWTKYVQPQIMKGDTATKLADFKSKCGFDPIASITSVSVAGSMAGSQDVVMVVHGLDKSKVVACVDKEKAEIEKDGTTLTKDGDFFMITKEGKTAAMTFVNDGTLVVGSGKYGSKASLVDVSAGKTALKTSATFTEMYKKIDTSKSIWFFANGSSKAFDQVQGMLSTRPVAVFGSLNVTDGIALDARMRVDSAGKATEMANTFKGQIEGLKQMADKAEMSADGSDVHVSIDMSQQKLQSAMQTFGPMLGLGGMGQ